MKTLLFHCALLALVYAPASGGAAQSTDAPVNLKVLMRDVCRNQAALLQRHDSRLRYRVHRTDHKGVSLRDYIESRDGSVARLLQHNEQTLTPDEDEGERKRLQAMLDGHKLQQREHDEAKNRASGVELLQVLPDAMLFKPAPQQTPVPDVQDKQVVVDFGPNPQFHPATMAQQMLPALSGRVWVDVVDHQLLRMELHNTADVNLAWGLLAKVYAGGSILYEQRKFQDVYTFKHIALHLRVRELMLKTVALETDSLANDVQRLPTSPSGDEAIRMLLAERVPTR